MVESNRETACQTYVRPARCQVCTRTGRPLEPCLNANGPPVGDQALGTQDLAPVRSVGDHRPGAGAVVVE